LLGAYFRSKLANILFTMELARRLVGSNATANCCGPGPTRTNFAPSAGGILGVLSRMMSWMPMVQTPEEGARTQVYLASSPEVAGVSGRSFLKCRAREAKPITRRPDVLARLWDVSEQLCIAFG
jgi:NAD(P)-dependent dehydrogenase (short-subunit alcohol dehydrogenase family)